MGAIATELKISEIHCILLRRNITRLKNLTKTAETCLKNHSLRRYLKVQWGLSL